MANFYRNVILGTCAAFILLIMVGFGLTSTTEAPKQVLTGGKDGTGNLVAVSHDARLTASGAYANNFSTVEKVRAWFGADINAERNQSHRSAELRKLKQRAKGVRTYNTRTKGVLYNGS